MAYSDFNENYQNRTAGLSAWLKSLQDSVSLQNQEARNAGFNATEVNEYQTQSAPVDFGSLNPNDKAIGLVQEAFSPGSADIHSSTAARQKETPFRDTFGGDLAAAFIPFAGPIMERQRNTALNEYAKHPPSDPLEMIQGLMELDPRNAQAYIPQLIAANTKDPAVQKHNNLLKTVSDLQKHYNSTEAGAEPMMSDGGMTPMPRTTSPLQSFAGNDQTPATSSPPIGAQGNNLINIRANPANQWQGATGENNGFVTFGTPEDGFRAGAKILNAYAARGIDTIDAAISTFAPASDGNDPALYADFVSKETGIPRGEKIDLSNPEIQTKLLTAMQKQEVGQSNAAPQGVVAAGVQMAGGNAAAPKQTALSEYQKNLLQFAQDDPETYLPKFSESLKDGGPFSGQGIEAQRENILLNPNADTSSPEYRAAYNQMGQPRATFDPMSGGITKIVPDMSAYRKPTQAVTVSPATTPEYGPAGSVDIAEPTGPTKVESSAFRKGKASSDTLLQTLDEFKTAENDAGWLEKGASVVGLPTDLNTKYNNAALLAKGDELYALGVLSGPDLNIIQKTIGDPSTWGGASASSETIGKQVETVKTLVKRGLNNKAKSLGLELPYHDIPLATNEDLATAIEKEAKRRGL